MGELGWTRDRWENCRSFDDYNAAVSGYWRNWERNTAWLMREVVYQMIIGNPAIPTENKPNSKDEVYKLSTDEMIKEKRKKEKIITPEELEIIRLRMLKHLK